MNRSWTLVLPAGGHWGWPPSANDRIHWRAKSLKIAEWRRRVFAAAVDAGIPHLDRARVSIIFFRQPGGVDHDADNLVSMCKAIYDGLVGMWTGRRASRMRLAGILDDDDAAHMVHGAVLEYREPRPMQPRIEVMVEEL